MSKPKHHPHSDDDRQDRDNEHDFSARANEDLSRGGLTFDFDAGHDDVLRLGFHTFRDHICAGVLALWETEWKA